MKARILSFAIALLVMFSIGLAYASHEQWNTGPCLDGNVFKGKITGIGNGDFTLRIVGFVDCRNPGSQDPPAWQERTLDIPFGVKKNGTYTFNTTLQFCKKRWTTTIQSITSIEVLDANGVPIPSLSTSSVPSCN